MLNPMVIINYIRENNLKKEEFCDLCKISTSELDNIIYFGEYNSELLDKISIATNIGDYEFCVKY